MGLKDPSSTQIGLRRILSIVFKGESSSSHFQVGEYLRSCMTSNFTKVCFSDDPVPISEPRQSLVAPCLGLGAHEAIAGYTEFSLQRCQ